MTDKFTFTNHQRSLLRASWSARLSKDKSAAVEKFIDSAESTLADFFDPECPYKLFDERSEKELRDLFDNLASFAWAARDAMSQLSEDERAFFNTSALWMFKRGLLKSEFSFPDEVRRDLLGGLNDLCLSLETVITARRPEKLKTGPHKPRESMILFYLIRAHLEYLGKVSASENGVFVRFLRTLGPMVNLQFGVDLLKNTLLIFS